MKKQKKLNWADKTLLTLMLLLLVSQLSASSRTTVKAQLNLDEYCAGAPECYPIDEHGNTLTELEFGEELKQAIQQPP
jgi:hypothetical protein